jgi:hypothetical protein
MIADVASPAQDHVIGANELGVLGGKQNFAAARTIAKPHEACVVFKARSRHGRHLALWRLDKCAA